MLSSPGKEAGLLLDPCWTLLLSSWTLQLSMFTSRVGGGTGLSAIKLMLWANLHAAPRVHKFSGKYLHKTFFFMYLLDIASRNDD